MMRWRNLGQWCGLIGLVGTLSACSSGQWVPFAGISSGPNKSYAAPVSNAVYTIEDIVNGSINGGCITNIRGVAIDEVGKLYRSDYPSSCGAAYLPAKWKPGMTGIIYWRVGPYPDWHPRVLPGGGYVHDQKEDNIISRYYENNKAIIPLPPPPPSAGNDFGETAGIIVHFLPCNQIFITYPVQDDYEPANKKRNFDLYMSLFRKSLTLCKKRPVIKSMADYHKHKAEMDAIKAERAQIPQVILPDYIKQLEAEGKLPNQQPAQAK